MDLKRNTRINEFFRVQLGESRFFAWIFVDSFHELGM
jgi:hypothetical protein